MLLCRCSSPRGPDGNATEFSNFYPSIGGKWLQLLKEAAPNIARVAIIFQPETGSGTTFDLH